MGVITAPFAATERRRPQLQIHNGPFDAVPVHDAPLSSTLGRRTKRDKPKDSQDNPPPPPPSPPPKDMSGSNGQGSDSGDEGLCTYTHHHTHTTPCSLVPKTKGPPTSSSVGVTESDLSADGPSTNSLTSENSTNSTSSGHPSTSSSATLSDGSPTTTTSYNAIAGFNPSTLASQTSSLIPPSSLSVPTSTSSAEANINSSPASTTSSAARVQSTNKAGPIAGSVIGGLVLILLFIFGTILFLRRRRRKRTPASAEFRDRYIPRSHVVTPLAMQGSSEYLDDRDPPDAPPPPFTQGDYSDPLFEKIAETRQAHMQYGFTR